MINFSSVLNLFSKFLFGVKFETFMPPRQGVFSLTLFSLSMISIQGKSGLFLHLLMDHCKIHRLNQSSSVALGAPLNFKYFLINIKLPNVWSVANVYCYDNIESRFGQSWDLWLEKFENKDQENLVSNLWRQNLHHKLAYETIGCRWERGISDHQIWYLVIVCS